MIEGGGFRFIAPLWLCLLPLSWWIVWLFARFNRRQSMWARLCDRQLLGKMHIDTEYTKQKHWSIWPLAIVLTLGIIAAAGPGWRQQANPVMESAGARIVALELSRAMLVRDVEPNRFAQALAAAREIVGADFDGETGLVVFAGAAFVVSPLSRDAKTLLSFLDVLEPGMMPVDGSRLDLAIDTARDLLTASVFGQGQIIVITSGNGDSEAAVRTAAKASTEGHRVSLMATGTRAGGPLIGPNGALVRDGGGKVVLAKTDFPTLERIAGAGNGVIVSLTRATAYNALLGSRIEAAGLVEIGEQLDSENREPANEGFWLIWLALPFALLLFRKNLVWVLLLALWLPADDELRAAESYSIWQHREKLAFNAYRLGDYQLAGELSGDPLLKGAAYYRGGRYQQALEVFTRDDSAQSFYNRGNTLARLDRYADAVGAYTRALEKNPGLGAARYNRRLVELFLEQIQGTDAALDEDPADDASSLDPGDQSGSENQVGTIGEISGNPGDEQQSESGIGASMPSDQVDPFEHYGDLEQQLERFSLAEGFDQVATQTLVEHWISNLPTASSDLFRRKFLRDYQRQRQQAR